MAAATKTTRVGALQTCGVAGLWKIYARGHELHDDEQHSFVITFNIQATCAWESSRKGFTKCAKKILILTLYKPFGFFRANRCKRIACTRHTESQTSDDINNEHKKWNLPHRFNLKVQKFADWSTMLHSTKQLCMLKVM